MYPLPALSCIWATQRLQAELLEERQESVAVVLLVSGASSLIAFKDCRMMGTRKKGGISGTFAVSD